MNNSTLSPNHTLHTPSPTNSRTDSAPPTTPLRAVSYCRVSSETQREKETVRTQIELNEKFCAANGYTLVETYIDDGVSGTTHLHERPAGARLLQDARAGKFDAVVVYKADRLGRSPLVNETLALEISGKLGIAIVGVAEQIDLSSPIGAAMFTFQSAIGRLERENTLQRSRDATLRLAREGAWLGGIVPFGYRVEGKERAARLVVADAVNPATNLSEADVVRLIYKLAGEEGKSSIQIAERLNVLGVPTSYARDGREVVRNKRKERTQEVWRPGRIRNMLVEPTYKGVHVWGKRSKTKLGAGGEVKGPPSSAPCPQLSTQSSGTRRN
ncbi:Site-specific DNA recombinase [Abditibacterium utsteinense]|uniref:Site-specific DNA recombinase n=1 Tax=Abditibacterium utsteinense TaxID=1960156 RepID=A0A2S8SP70_9BACT|nr:Site-specific DNA recombinase [Abditibacterium utsteinense]